MGAKPLLASLTTNYRRRLSNSANVSKRAKQALEIIIGLLVTTSVEPRSSQKGTFCFVFRLCGVQFKTREWRDLRGSNMKRMIKLARAGTLVYDTSDTKRTFFNRQPRR